MDRIGYQLCHSHRQSKVTEIMIIVIKDYYFCVWLNGIRTFFFFFLAFSSYNCCDSATIGIFSTSNFIFFPTNSPLLSSVFINTSNFLVVSKKRRRTLVFFILILTNLFALLSSWSTYFLIFFQILLIFLVFQFLSVLGRMFCAWPVAG